MAKRKPRRRLGRPKNAIAKKRRYRGKSKRNFDDPRYIEWRKAVYERDKFQCRICGGNNNIEAHHIRMWSKYPERRFMVSNGITLCHNHHKMTLGFEEQYEVMFFRILASGD